MDFFESLLKPTKTFMENAFKRKNKYIYLEYIYIYIYIYYRMYYKGKELCSNRVLKILENIKHIYYGNFALILSGQNK